MTTLLLSAHNAGWAPNFIWVGTAIFYGGLAQFLAGMWSFRRGNVFTATAFSTYGAFWLSLATCFLLFWSMRTNTAVFAVFLTLEIAEILLFIANFNGSKAGEGLVMVGGLVGGLVGVVTAAVAFYTSAADVISWMAGRPVLPVGQPMWSESRRRG